MKTGSPYSSRFSCRLVLLAILGYISTGDSHGDTTPRLNGKTQTNATHSYTYSTITPNYHFITNDSYRLLWSCYDYITILKPSRTYGIEFWGWTRRSYSYRLKSLQIKILRNISNDSYYVSSLTLYTDQSFFCRCFGCFPL